MIVEPIRVIYQSILICSGCQEESCGEDQCEYDHLAKSCIKYEPLKGECTGIEYFRNRTVGICSNFFQIQINYLICCCNLQRNAKQPNILGTYHSYADCNIHIKKTLQETFKNCTFKNFTLSYSLQNCDCIEAKELVLTGKYNCGERFQIINILLN